MGDIADMMIEGFLDSETGEFIDGDAPGYPRTIGKTLPWEQHSKRRSSNAKFGITSFLNKRGIPIDKHIDILRGFFPNENNSQATKENLCNRISTDFDNFKNYVEETVKP